MILFEEEACVKALPLLYCKLKGNLNIVVICNYDSYGAKKYCYTFKNRCKQVADCNRRQHCNAD